MDVLIRFRQSVKNLPVWKLFVLSIIPSAIGGFVSYHYGLESWGPFIQGCAGLILLAFLIRSISFNRKEIYIKWPVLIGISWMFLLGMSSYFVVDMMWGFFKILMWEFDRDWFNNVYPYYSILSSCDCELNYKSMQYYLFAILLTPIGEEVFHRRMILSKLLQKHGVIYSLVISSLLFSVLHPDHPFPAFMFGIALGWVFIRTGNLLYVIIMHSGINFTVFNINKVTGYLWEKDMENFSSLSNWTWEIVFGLFSILMGWWIARKMGLLTSAAKNPLLIRGI